MISLCLETVISQTYTEVNVFGWGKGINESYPAVYDIDNDGYMDLLIGAEFGLIDVVGQSTPRFTDTNKDGREDIFVSGRSGGISLFLRNEDLDLTAPDIPENLRANIIEETVELSWSPSSAEDLILYNIYRGTRNTTATAEYINSVGKQYTSYLDTNLTKSGAYYYWITALDLVGNESDFSDVDSVNIEITGIVHEDKSIPGGFMLYQNYPNPFNAVTTIRYHISIPAVVGTQDFASLPYVTITIHNILGKRIAILVSKNQGPGYHTVKWDARSFASGIYCCRLTCGSKSRTITLHLIR